ncbi:MAG TPA: DUF1648 domain-containing protein [Lutibacter sp.]|nr:DUF1648 domain-containing protein [Lutibacter sp.]
MKFNLKKELPVLAIVAIPFIYLAYVWNSLPEKVPMHWNIKGEIDRWGEKEELILIPFLLPLLVYLIFLVVPFIDPKKQLNKMGSKYQSLKLIFTLLMSLLAVFIIYTAKESTFSNPNYIFILIGILFIVLGNFFQTIKPNYFIGIKTPWTLENEDIWKKTHLLGGKMWFVGGLVIILTSLVLKNELAFVFFITITLALAFIPILYSYLLYKKGEIK